VVRPVRFDPPARRRMSKQLVEPQRVRAVEVDLNVEVI
jgi:hypothetical protein